MHVLVLLDEIFSLDSLNPESPLYLSDDVFTTRMWRMRMSCEGISGRLNFKSVGDALSSIVTVMATMKRHAKCESKKLQVRKELLRVQDLGEDAAAIDNSNSSQVEVCRAIDAMHKMLT